MPAPSHRPPLQKQDAAAVVLVVLGIIGMIRHLVLNSGIAETPPAQQQRVSQAVAVPRASSAPGDGTARDHPGVSEAARGMRQQLREFVIPLPGVIRLSVPDALAKLQDHWQTLPHETDTVPPASFTLDAKASRQLEIADPPTVVSLPISNVSLLTNLRLLAAQCDLKLETGRTGVVLRPGSANNQLGPSSGYALSGNTLSRFIGASCVVSRSPDGVTVTVIRPLASSTDALQQLSTIAQPSPPNPGPHGDPADPQTTTFDTKINDDGTIDVNLTTDVIAFEGFINYSGPIQITGLSLAREKPAFLNDVQFPDPLLTADPRLTALRQIFGPMGIANLDIKDSSEAAGPGYSWSASEGSLTASGPLRFQRMAEEVAAAIQESVRLGARVEFSPALGWEDGKPPEPPVVKNMPPTAAKPSGFSRRKAAYGNAYLTLRSGDPSTASVSVAMPASRSVSLLPQAENNLKAKIEAAGAGFRVRASLDIPEAPNFASPNPNAVPTVKRVVAQKFMVPGRSWRRLDYPISGAGHRQEYLSVFVRLARASISDDG